MQVRETKRRTEEQAREGLEKYWEKQVLWWRLHWSCRYVSMSKEASMYAQRCDKGPLVRQRREQLEAYEQIQLLESIEQVYSTSHLVLSLLPLRRRNDELRSFKSEKKRNELHKQWHKSN